MLDLINKVVSLVTGTKQPVQEFVCEEPDESPYRIPTLNDVERAKEARQRRYEKRFQKDVEEGITAVCNQLREGNTHFRSHYTGLYTCQVVFSWYHDSPEFIAEVNKRLKTEGWEVSVSVVEGARTHTVSVNARYIGKEE